MSEECPICYEKMENEKTQICGHIVHLDCLKKQFKPECPLCRTKLDIVVQGTLNGVSYTENDTYLESYHEEKLDQYNEWLSENIEDEEDEDDEETTWRWASRGYNYPEEDPEFDEENPRGDDWYYDDEE